MTRHALLLSVALLAAASGPAHAGAGSFNLVNGTSKGLADVAIRRAGTNDWKPLATAPAPGASGQVAFEDPDCAFDIKATVPGSGAVTWAGVNLCGAKSVILKQDDSAGPWVDYDQ